MVQVEQSNWKSSSETTFTMTKLKLYSCWKKTNFENILFAWSKQANSIVSQKNSGNQNGKTDALTREWLETLSTTESQLITVCYITLLGISVWKYFLLMKILMWTGKKLQNLPIRSQFPMQSAFYTVPSQLLNSVIYGCQPLSLAGVPQMDKQIIFGTAHCKVHHSLAKMVLDRGPTSSISMAGKLTILHPFETNILNLWSETRMKCIIYVIKIISSNKAFRKKMAQTDVWKTGSQITQIFVNKSIMFYSLDSAFYPQQSQREAGTVVLLSLGHIGFAPLSIERENK